MTEQSGGLIVSDAPKPIIVVNAAGETFVDWDLVTRVAGTNDPSISAYAKMALAIRDGTCRPMQEFGT